MGFLTPCITDFAAQQQVECIGLVHIQALEDMVTDMIMIAMKAAMVEMKNRMVMGEKESMAIGMMTEADMGTRTVGIEIVMVEIMKNITAEKVLGMMIIGEEVEVLMTINMDQEVGALTEIVLLMMMVNHHLGMFHFLLGT